MINLKTGHIVNGQELNDNGNVIEILNPTSEKKLSEITSATDETVKAIESSISARRNGLFSI